LRREETEKLKSMGDELLFNKYEIYGVVQGRTETVKKRVA